MSQPQPLSFDSTDPMAQPSSVDRLETAPREADQIHSPVGSPVHLLQQELLRFESSSEATQSAVGLNISKAPAWVQLALPVTLSVALWTGIFYFVVSLT